MVSDYNIGVLDVTNCSLAELKHQQIELFDKLIKREKEFAFNESIFVDYPNPLQENGFLTNPLGYIDTYSRKFIETKHEAIDEIVILTTYGDLLIDKLTQDGFIAEPINMPAGPDNTYKFSKKLNLSQRVAPSILYFEVVNEEDPKIYPTFIAKLENAGGVLCGGMSGSIWTAINGIKYAYISTVIVDNDLPNGLGTMIANKVFEYLQANGVMLVNLGTQTAVSFYQKCGFNVIHKIVPNLRVRYDKFGNAIKNDLVIMEKKL